MLELVKVLASVGFIGGVFVAWTESSLSTPFSRKFLPALIAGGCLLVAALT